MKIGHLFKVFQYNLLRQGGVAVTPEQLGLKTDPYAGTVGNSPFSQILQNQQNMLGMTLPMPPVAPTEVGEGQGRFNQEMIAYNQRLHAYNQRMMQIMMMQISQLQREAVSARQPETVQGAGGILGDSLI